MKTVWIEDSDKRKEKVESALRKQVEIRESVYRPANIKEKAVLLSLGVEVSNSSEESTSEVNLIMKAAVKMSRKEASRF